MKNKKVRIILIILICALLAIIFIPKVLIKFNNPDVKVAKYVNEKYGNTVNNIKLLESEQAKSYTTCDGSVLWSQPVRGSYIYYYSAYSIENDFTFYIYYNYNNGKDIFEDTFEAYKKFEEVAKEQIDYIKNDVKVDIISATYKYSTYEELYKNVFYHNRYLNIEINVDEELDELINKSPYPSIREFEVGRHNADISIEFMCKDGKKCRFDRYGGYIESQGVWIELED